MIAAVYEHETGFSPPTRLSRKDQASGKIGPNFFNLGAGTEETREYTMSPTQMLRAVWDRIERFGESHVPDAFRQKDPFWTKGWLCGEYHRMMKDSVTPKEYHHFSIANFDDDSSPHIHLATHDTFFSSGYDEVATNKEILSDYMWEPVESLLRPLFANPHQQSYLFAPFVILRSGTIQTDGQQQLIT
ncbi:MAG TPA: hypothetical protein VK581_05900 [Chthoniobacterales bacterium]|nr:hypothetical protein [Chthoniobacterales bacterium]